MCCIHLFSGISELMSSDGSSPHRIERRKKSRCDVDAGEGGSRNRPPRRQSKRTVHRDFPRGHMHNDMEIVEEDPMKTSDYESADDETYRMSPVPPSKNNVDDDVKSNDSGLR
jgi:hypothetical protein